VTRPTQDPARPAGPAGVHPSGRTHPARGRRTSLTGRAAILAVVLGALVVTLAIPVREWFAQRAEIAALTQAVADAEVRVAGLEADRARWNDPAYVETQARARLQYVMPGEVGYVVVDDRAAAEDEGGEPAEPTSDEPWYSRLWGSVRSADAPPPAPR
jgi:cell division protein FtsB